MTPIATLVNNASNVVTRNSSVSPFEKFQSDKNNKPSKNFLAQNLDGYKIGSGF